MQAQTDGLKITFPDALTIDQLDAYEIALADVRASRQIVTNAGMSYAIFTAAKNCGLLTVETSGELTAKHVMWAAGKIAAIIGAEYDIPKG